MASKKPKEYESKVIYFPRKVKDSKAYWALTGLASQYLSEFLGRRQMKYVRAENKWVQRNNGEIVFPYAEAKKRHGVTPARHLRALKKLHEVGFIDINHFGGGMDGDCTTFYISNRWKQFGTPDFEEKEWPKDTRRKGNPKIKNYGKGRKVKHNYYP